MNKKAKNKSNHRQLSLNNSNSTSTSYNTATMPAFFGSPSKASTFPPRKAGGGAKKGGRYNRTFDDGLEGTDGSSFERDRHDGDDDQTDVIDEFGNISAIIGKTFEAVTLPDGTQQIVEDTVYKRLNDGYIYTERKTRRLELDNESNQEQQPQHKEHRSEKHHSGELTDVDLHEEREGCDTIGDLASPVTIPYEYSHSNSHSTDNDENTNFMSVITEDHEGVPRHQFVEEYLYDKDPTGLLQWEEQSKPLSPSAQQGKNSSTGWCPYEEATEGETDVDSIQLMKSNSRQLPMMGLLRSSSLHAKGWIHSWFESGSIEHQSVGDDEGSGAPLELTHGKKSSDDIDEYDVDEERGTGTKLRTGRKLLCRTDEQKPRSRRCKLMTFLILLVVICTITAVPLLMPKTVSSANTADAFTCVNIKVVMNITDKQDTNTWSLCRVSDIAGAAMIHSSTNGFPESLVGEESRTYESCVQPGIYEFTISDSGGDGLGVDGKGGYYITADGITLGVSSFFFHEEKMTFELPFDAEEENATGNDTACTDDFYLAIKTDANPEETSWNVVDADTGDQVLTGGPYDLPWAVYSRRACLPNGNYTFNMLDEGGDGIHGIGEKGFYVLSKDGETIIQSDGQYGSGNSTDFVLRDESV